MESVGGWWWCPACEAWCAQEDVRQAERDEVCLEVCRRCDGIVDDRRWRPPGAPA